MAPPDYHTPVARRDPDPSPSVSQTAPTRSHLTLDGTILEAWAEGYNVGSLIILILIVFCNYRSGVWLHKLILLELVLALWHGTFIFAKDPYYGWYLSSTATLLFISYLLHNIISWLKIRPFLPRWGSRLFIGTLIAVQPFWVVEAYGNWEYFNNLGSRINVSTRPWEALARDPWWIFTTWKLIDSIKKTYGLSIWTLIKISPRFGVMTLCMAISIVFLLTDVIVTALHITVSAGINPYWRFALVFKCASDTIFLDDFKSVLDEIVARSLSSSGGRAHSARRKTHTDFSHRKIADSNFPEFIECGPMTTDITSPNAARSRSMNPFGTREQRMSQAKIHVKKETTVTVSKPALHKPSVGSFDSAQNILPKPSPAFSQARDDDIQSVPHSHSEAASEDVKGYWNKPSKSSQV